MSGGGGVASLVTVTPPLTSVLGVPKLRFAGQRRTEWNDERKKESCKLVNLYHV